MEGLVRFFLLLTYSLIRCIFIQIDTFPSTVCTAARVKTLNGLNVFPRTTMTDKWSKKLENKQFSGR